MTVLCNMEREITAEFRNCESTVLHNAFPHKLHKVVRIDRWPPTALLIMHILSTCCKLSALATSHLLAHDFRPIDLAQLTKYFERRYPLCIHRSHFTVGGSWNKSLLLQPLQRCYREGSGSPASACVMRRHYSITYTQSLRAINCLLALGRVRNVLCGRPSICCTTAEYEH